MNRILKPWILILIVVLISIIACGGIEPTPTKEIEPEPLTEVEPEPPAEDEPEPPPDDEEIEPPDESEPEPPVDLEPTLFGLVGEFRGLTASVLYGRMEQDPLPPLPDTNNWHELFSNHVVTVDETGEAELRFGSCAEPAFLRLLDGSRLEFSSCSSEELGTTLCLTQGLAIFDGACSEAYEFIETPSARLLAKGTSFQVSYLPESMITRVVVDDGEVDVTPLDENGIPTQDTQRVQTNQFLFTTPLPEYATLNGITAAMVLPQVGNLLALNDALGPIVASDTILQTANLNTWETRSTEIRIAELAAPVIQQGGGQTRDTVYERGLLVCGLRSAPGFTTFQENGTLVGFDVDFCRALAAALLGKADAFEALLTTASERFPVLLSGEVDTFMSSDSIRFDELGFDFTYVTFQDGQGFMASRALGANTVQELAGSTICVTEGLDQVALEKTFRDRGINIRIQVYPTSFDAFAAYEAGYCEALSSSRVGLGSFRASSARPEAHVILDEAISIDPNGPVSRLEDQNWTEILRWTILCTINAEALGIYRRNVDEFINSTDPNVSALLGNSGALGETLGLRSDFCYQVIRQVGNYAEIYERHFGLKTPFGIPRGQNALYKDGGLLYPQFSYRIQD